MEHCLGAPSAAQVFGDVANFTDARPIAFVAEPLAG
jgi:hypothetical protein